MDVKKYIEGLAQNYLADKPDLFLVEVVISGSNKKSKVLVLIDGDQGVTIAQCAELSRKIAHELEEKEIMDSAYRLEVSSPGVEFPLKYQRQYPKHIGRKVKVLFKDDLEITGMLKEVGIDFILIEEEVKEGKKTNLQEVQIKLEDIKTMIVLVSFK